MKITRWTSRTYALRRFLEFGAIVAILAWCLINGFWIMSQAWGF